MKPPAGVVVDAPLRTPDGRYIVVRGRLWRATNPGLGAARQRALRVELMAARRAVRSALLEGSTPRLRAARDRVHAAKVKLGERGPAWWDDGAPDYNRRLAKDSPYAGWYAALRPPRGGARTRPPARRVRPRNPRGTRGRA